MVGAAAGWGYSAMTTTDPDYERHLQGWRSFGRLLRWVVSIIIIILAGMAYFLLITARFIARASLPRSNLRRRGSTHSRLLRCAQ